MRALAGRGTVRPAAGPGRLHAPATPSTGLTPAPVTLAPTTMPVSSPTAIVVLPTATPAPSPEPAPTELAAPTVAPTPTAARFTEAQVIEVIDGDTIKVLVAGAQLKLRYIGIDTPEMSGADGEAARANRTSPWQSRPIVWVRRLVHQGFGGLLRRKRPLALAAKGLESETSCMLTRSNPTWKAGWTRSDFVTRHIYAMIRSITR